jgi:hypothetical protein
MAGQTQLAPNRSALSRIPAVRNAPRDKKTHPVAQNPWPLSTMRKCSLRASICSFTGSCWPRRVSAHWSQPPALMRNKCCSMSRGSSPGSSVPATVISTATSTPEPAVHNRARLIAAARSALQSRGAQIHHRATRFGQAVPGHPARQIQIASRGRGVLRHAHGHRIQCEEIPTKPCARVS